MKNKQLAGLLGSLLLLGLAQPVQGETIRSPLDPAQEVEPLGPAEIPPASEEPATPPPAPAAKAPAEKKVKRKNEEETLNAKLMLTEVFDQPAVTTGPSDPLGGGNGHDHQPTDFRALVAKRLAGRVITGQIPQDSRSKR